MPRISSVASLTPLSWTAGSLIVRKLLRAAEGMPPGGQRKTAQFARDVGERTGGLSGLGRGRRVCPGVQLALEDLAGRVARQLVDEGDLARRLVCGKVRLDVDLELLLGGLGALGGDDERLQ